MKRLYFSVFFIVCFSNLTAAEAQSGPQVETVEPIFDCKIANLPAFQELDPTTVQLIFKELITLKPPTMRYNDETALLTLNDNFKLIHTDPTKRTALFKLLIMISKIAVTASQECIPSAKKTIVAPMWCNCMDDASDFSSVRLTWSLFTVLAITNTFKNKIELEQPLVYTSLASGSLQQDWIILASLIKLGVKSLSLNFIDFTYKYDYKLHTIYKKKFPPELYKSLSKKQENHELLQRYFKSKLIELLTQHHNFSSIPVSEKLKIIFWAETNDYLDLSEDNDLLSDVILVADPDTNSSSPTYIGIIKDFEKLVLKATAPVFVSGQLRHVKGHLGSILLYTQVRDKEKGTKKTVSEVL